MIPARKYGLAGVGLFIVGFLLGGIANSAEEYLPLASIGDTLTGLGFVLSIIGAARAGSSIRELLVIGTVFGIGTFYLAEPHPTHEQSGIGFGLEHLTHIFIGLALIALATAAGAILSFHRTTKGTSS